MNYNTVITYKEFGLINYIVEKFINLPDIIDVINYNKEEYDSIFIKTINDIDNECDYFVERLRCPEDYNYEYPTEDIKHRYYLLDKNHYRFCINNDIYNLTINIDNIKKEITVIKELNDDKFEMVINYSLDY